MILLIFYCQNLPQLEPIDSINISQRFILM